MRVTIKDIAERAGVSKTAVSFALNRPDRISAETREHILAIVREMGYIPDPVARTLTTKRLGVLGLLLPQPIHDALRNPYLCEMIRGIGTACEERELSLAMLPPVKGRIIEAARRSFVDGILTVGVGPDHEVVDLLHRRHIPFVTIDGVPSERTANVGIDDVAAARSLMEHIIGLGHRRIAILGLEPDIFGDAQAYLSLISTARARGFLEALDSARARSDDLPDRISKPLSLPSSLGDGSTQSEPVWLLSDPPWFISLSRVTCSRTAGSEAAERILTMEPVYKRPTAVIAMADIVALGIIDACHRFSVPVPGSLSVAGFDDIPDASLSHPALTTMRQPAAGKGLEATRLLLSLLDGSVARHKNLDTGLIIRASTTKPCAGSGTG